jgi:hypothetical protein
LPSIERLADARAQRRDERLDFVVAQDFVQPGALGVENLAAQGQDGLEVAVAPLLGRAAGRVTLDDVQFALAGSRSEQSASLPGSVRLSRALLRMTNSRALPWPRRGRASW